MEASKTRDVTSGRFLRLILPVTIVVFMGASSPWIAQRAPRFLFPALAVSGAVLVTRSFVDSLARFVQHYSGERRLRFFPVVLNAIAGVSRDSAFHAPSACDCSAARWNAANSHRLWRVAGGGGVPTTESPSRP